MIYLTRNTVGFCVISLQHLNTVPRATRPDTRITVVLKSYWEKQVLTYKCHDTLLFHLNKLGERDHRDAEHDGTPVGKHGYGGV